MDNTDGYYGNALGKGTRGSSWTRQEIRCLMSVWGDAELKFCFSSLRRNIHIFTYMSAELLKLNVKRSALEIRTKTKLLRRDFKRAIAQNSRTGGSPAEFIWMEEMQRIFRGDPSMQPHRATESGAPRKEGTNVTMQRTPRHQLEQQGDVEETASDCHRSCNGDDTQSQEELLNASSSVSDIPNSDTADLQDEESSTPEEAMDPASRIAQIRRRKKRASAATKLDDTLNNYFDWIKSANKENQSLFRGSVQRLGNLMEAAIHAFQLESSKARYHGEECVAEDEHVSQVFPHPALQKVVRSCHNKKLTMGKQNLESTLCPKGSIDSGGKRSREQRLTSNLSLLRQSSIQSPKVKATLVQAARFFGEGTENNDIDVPEVLVYDTCTDVETEPEQEDVLNKSVSLLDKTPLSKFRKKEAVMVSEKHKKSAADFQSTRNVVSIRKIPASRKSLEASYEVPTRGFLTSTPLEQISNNNVNMESMSSFNNNDPYVLVKDEHGPCKDLLVVTPVKRFRKPRIVFSPQ